ncbi:KptA family-domain-containing protein [Mycena latifolia]|nr:KptA family-domain-containing protein [Mycena latifolia]
MLPTRPLYRVFPVLPRTATPPASQRPFPLRRKGRHPGQDPREVRISRELSYILRHGAKSEGLPIRPDGYADVDVLLRHRSFRGVDFSTLESVVKNDPKQRYHLLYEPRPDSTRSWWIRANQGHSMSDISLDMKRITSIKEIPMAVHGTTMKAWEIISKQGLSRMSRNHIHLAQGVVGAVTSGMRSSSEVMIFIDVERALEEDIKFYLSRNGVVLTPGNDMGYLEPRFFDRVERVDFSADPIPGWDAREDDEVKNDDLDEVPPEPIDPQEARKRAAKQRREARREAHTALMRRLYAPELGMV